MNVKKAHTVWVWCQVSTTFWPYNVPSDILHILDVYRFIVDRSHFCCFKYWKPSNLALYCIALNSEEAQDPGFGHFFSIKPREMGSVCVPWRVSAGFQTRRQLLLHQQPQHPHAGLWLYKGSLTFCTLVSLSLLISRSVFVLETQQ